VIARPHSDDSVEERQTIMINIEGLKHFGISKLSVSTLGVSTVILGGVMGASAFAQQATVPAASTTATSQSAPASADDSTTYATGKPLESQSKEGFWGKVNPFARKKWVAREVDPIRDRTNELDQLQAKNANQIKDVDARATAGINNALMAANTADTHAADAAAKANVAQTTANGATAQAQNLNGTVSNLDQYSQVAATDVTFRVGRTTLGTDGKSSLDDMATKLTNEKGYIIEVQGYSKAGVQTSQAMADAVVRYLVTEHQVPIYRIYRTGLGKNTDTPADGQEALVNGVRVTLLHNSLATMSATNGAQPAMSPAPSGQAANR
jgi:outer membrane protein OmpA-like peptidoglycan-associated protein